MTLTLPPDGAWIERREQYVTEVEESHTGNIPGKRTRRIIGNLRGAWPEHGRVRHIPSESGDPVVVTEASLVVLPDDSIRAELT